MWESDCLSEVCGGDVGYKPNAWDNGVICRRKAVVSARVLEKVVKSECVFVYVIKSVVDCEPAVISPSFQVHLCIFLTTNSHSQAHYSQFRLTNSS